MHRHATRLGAHLGIVTDHEQIIEHAGALGIPVFDSVTTAHIPSGSITASPAKCYQLSRLDIMFSAARREHY